MKSRFSAINHRLRKQPKISVIIPCYNYAQVLPRAIDSVLQQTEKRIEIIVVNDGSPDHTRQVAERYGDTIRYYEQVNQGVVAARNAGARLAEGDFLCFLDADDVLYPPYLKRLRQQLDRSPAEVAFAYCDFALVDQQQTVIQACPWNKRKLLYRNYLISASVVRADAFHQVGGFTSDEDGNNIFEDWDLWLKLAAAGYRGAYVPEVLYEYRLHQRSRGDQNRDRREQFERQLPLRYPELYKPLEAQLYLALFRTASRIRNAIFPPPGH